MPVSFKGNYPAHTRIVTGCVSMDRAVAGTNFKSEYLPGLPLRCGYHVWSKTTGIGKTTFLLSIIGMIATQLKKDVAVAPIDTFDIGNLGRILNYTGMNGSVEITLSDAGHADSLNLLNKVFAKSGYCASLLDSAYSVMSTAVEEGEIEDANMGRDAKMISTYSRQAKGIIDSSKEDKTFFVANMSFADMGGRHGFGPMPYIPARGKTLMGLTSIHIDLSQAYIGSKPVKFDEGRLLKGKVVKNNFGPDSREFNVFTLGGVGIHKGITAAYDCLNYGLAKINRGKFSVFGMDIASPATMIEQYDDDELFLPFHQALLDNYSDIMLGKLSNTKKKVSKKVEEDEDDEIDNDGQTPEELNA